MPTSAKNYRETLRDPRWQRRRLDVLNAANWRCQDAGCLKTDAPLEVHHCYYIYGTKPWDYPPDAFLALCEGCHERRQKLEGGIKIELFRALRLVPIRRLEQIAWKLVNEARNEQEVSS